VSTPKSAQPDYERPHARRLKNAARPVRHLRSRTGMQTAWRNLARDVFSPRVCKDMPPYVQDLAETFWKADPSAVTSAIIHGDPAFFVAFQLRLDQIDCELVKAGYGLAKRTPVVRAKYIIDGFMQTAVQVLEEKGGAWPPTPGAPAESSDR
jgi:hypothetical protein